MEEKGTKSKHFLGENYYRQYKMILSIVIPCVVFGTCMAWLIEIVKQPDPHWYIVLGWWMHKMISGIVTACIVLGIVFAILEKLEVPVNIIPSSLVNTSHQKGRIKRGEVVAEILFGTFFTLVFLLVPEIFCGVFERGTEIIPVFNTAFIENSWRIIMGMWALGLLSDLAKLICGRYNVVVLVMTVIANIGTGVMTCVWLGSGQLIHQQFIDKIVGLIGTQEALITYVLSHTQTILLAIIVFGLIVDTIVVLAKTTYNAIR
ncbi:MAG: hypothetical protein ACRCTE_11495 [Cellulosilyticaceae bacterium]